MQLHVMKSCSNLHVACRERSWSLHSVLLPKLECFVNDELHRRIFGEVLVEGEAVMMQKMHTIKYTMHCIKDILYHTTTCLALYAWQHRERLSKTAGKAFVSVLNVEAQEGWLIVTTCTYKHNKMRVGKYLEPTHTISPCTSPFAFFSKADSFFILLSTEDKEMHLPSLLSQSQMALP